ncbi:MAG: pyrrolysine--tRNA(Pyl) ligase large subunit [Thermodesulfobacteriota bacterium]
MSCSFSETQRQRLRELGAPPEEIETGFDQPQARDRTFQTLEKRYVKRERERLLEFREKRLRPRLCVLENELAEVLAAHGFVQVATPILMSKGLLARMGIDESHPLHAQVFWVGPAQCLRPMLAPHLYYVVKDLLRLWARPVGLFEVGPCFRKESQGSAHANEFTMLNLAEFGLPEDHRIGRLRELAALIMKKTGIEEYEIVIETSEVYGETYDLVAGPDRLEVASCALGPHHLDSRWSITDAWVGLGFGLERLLMAAGENLHLGRLGRSLSYLDGIRLNI